MVGDGSLPSSQPLPLPPSDPVAKQRAATLSSFDLFGGQFPLAFYGEVGPATWAQVGERTTAAFQKFGIELNFVRRPLFDKESSWTSEGERGYGHFVGESGLRLLSKTTILGADMFESILTTVQFWIDPPLPRGDPNQHDAPHLWKCAVRVRHSQTQNADDRHSGPYRRTPEPLPTDPSLSWLPKAIYDMLR